MSSIAIPILTSILPALPGIIQSVESLFGAGNGPQKLAAATSLAQAGVNAAVAAGALPAAAAPAAKDITAAVQSTVTQMQSAGQLPAHTTGPAPAAIPAAQVAPAAPTGTQSAQFLADLSAGLAAEIRSPGVTRTLLTAITTPAST